MSMKTVVITGSTKGIGFGLAQEFLKGGHNVVISGRRQDTVDAAVASLHEYSGKGRVIGVACDVADVAQVQNLWRQAAKVFGRVDIWINNAGLINKYLNVGQLVPTDISSVVETNLCGAMNGTSVAAKAMAGQEPVGAWRGAIYNFEGFGSDGMTRNGLSVYGSTKRALSYFTGAAAKELKDKGVLVGFIQPGIVVTELSVGAEWGESANELRRKKKFIMMFGDPVPPVAAFIVDKVLANEKSGYRANWLPFPKLLWRLITAPFIKRDPIGEAGLL
jgi:NAD(P)-dependent dehydrogenase (short-subunit alcohol dehydrogenase family)